MKFHFLVPALLVSTFLSAQTAVKLPEFGKVDVADLKMSSCAFEKNAPAMILFNAAESFFNRSAISQTEHHVRIKIFNKKAFDEANIKIRYRSDKMDVSIKKLVAQTYTLDDAGNVVVTKVDKASVYDKRLNKRYSEKSFAFPNVKEGSIIEYKYVLDGATETHWYFQKSIPVQYSRFITNLAQEIGVAVTPNCTLPFKTRELKGAGLNVATEYTMENIPGLSDEAYMTCREDYLQRLQVRQTYLDIPGQLRQNYVRTWPGIIKELMEDEDFGMQLKKNIPRTADLDALLKPVSDPYQKMCIIHKYVRNNMEWNNYDNIWALDGVKSAWKDKKGTSGEINLILINLLKDADLDVHPVLVSSRDNGMINTGVAGFEQFNKVLAYVTINRRSYVLDATEKFTPSYLMPMEVLSSEGLLIEKLNTYEWGWRTLWDDAHKINETVLINASVDDKGIFSGNATLVEKDYAKAKLLPLLKDGNDKLKAIVASQPGVTIDSFTVEGAEVDSLPLKQNFNFVLPAGASGDYKYFSMNLFTGLEKNPFVADDRQTDIFFGTNQKYSIYGTIVMPDDYQFEELPKSVKMIMPDTSIVFIRRSSFSGGILSVNISLEFNTPVYSLDNYPIFNEFYKKLFELLNEQFVYKKK